MTDFPHDMTVFQLATELGGALHRRGWRLSTAESCTGGGIAAAVTDIAGSSAWFDYGLVTYANNAKRQLLGVDPDVLEAEGAVSEAVALQMVDGALRVSGADLAVAVTGIAGPGGGTAEKPVGTVWLGWGLATGWRRTHCYHFAGDRAEVRRQSIVAALRELLVVCKNPENPV
ncbi:CinA family protein [Marinimicrobium sp. ABcell2]|uniref:CinA family protein n=1 Tax=Marinimicrobium sp. ABcell2 TaxID=3069751 RepID=UPI0027B82DAE|nr:nicotinamide-nucleotide amidohydrolase family protein [Marinimicrobium sp. ABcell2]MDQ2075414.1 nicotinamide-nucleotide amidohydrolase family protein [Marinimicrobium sp. ABcell2]